MLGIAFRFEVRRLGLAESCPLRACRKAFCCKAGEPDEARPLCQSPRAAEAVAAAAGHFLFVMDLSGRMRG